MLKSIAKTVGVCLAAALMTSGLAHAQQKLVFATNWKAQGSHGGFYQAIADGTYKRYGLDVEIMQGGPQVNARPLLMVGKVDLLMSQSLISAMEANATKMPTTVVAAFMQKDATSLMAHAGQYKDFAELSKAKTVFVAKASQFGFWKWLTASRGFSDAQFKQYNYSMSPFLADKASVQQAYVTAEPLYLEMQGVKTDVFLLADLGYEAYANMVEARRDMIDKQPEVIQKFIDASAIGWYNFMYGDRKAAYELIKKDNPDMTDAKMDAEVGMAMKRGLIDSGDALTKGLGALSVERLRRFNAEMVKAGVFAAGAVDVDSLGTERFVNKGVGLDLRAKLVK
ncbi:ABC transporter substrate-binding protein [Variovorax sp. YR216]|uniref:ABC transporter substrate-binding protein n=1 Tax=Variovorax sp. YR216 TaxID=1882828 RepID=UPI00089BF439|nr:ABC transporter substrate-binding protein [Variovorax sp. YR216]SEB25748.1 NitT/TauT family transport system substrate-binding protein [Variovorax sp. YR216]